MARTRKFITDLEKLRKSIKPLRFITSDGSIEQEEGNKIIEQLKTFLDKNSSLLAIAAPQLGINARVFCIRFDDTIKSFINPITTKKSNYKIAPEIFSSMPGKEILISRPEEISVVYYTDNFKYEDNKLLGPAARIFDQMAQLLDGVIPSDLGLVSDIETDGSFFDLSEEEMDKAKDIWKQFVEIKLKSLEAEINSDEKVRRIYNNLRFSESVINGRATVIADDPKASTSKAKTIMTENRARKAQMSNFVRSKKH